MKQNSLSFLIVAGLLCGVMPLAGCTQISSLFHSNDVKPAHAKHVPRPVYNADDYVSNLTLSRLNLSSGIEHAEETTDNVTIINGYALQKKHKTERMTVIVIDYKTKSDASVQQIVAPASVNKTDFASLQSVMNRFSAMDATIQNIRLLSVTVRPDKSLTLPKDSGQILSALEAQQQHLLAQSHSLVIADDIKTQLALIDCFKKSHFQDAAYLSVDNVKRMLGKAAQNKSIDDSTLQTFSKDLETKESSLKEALPYKL